MKFQVHRLVGLSDAMIAIIMTIMVLELPLPQQFTTSTIIELLRVIVVYFATFMIVAIHWYMQSNLLKSLEKTTGKVVWCNTLYLFFLSLMPLFTRLMIENPQEIFPAVGYNIVYLLLRATFGYMADCVLQQSLSQERLEKIAKKKNNQKRYWILFGITFAGEISILGLSLVWPFVSIICLIVFPISISLVGMLIKTSANMEI